MKMLTTEKISIINLTMKELLDEYRATCDKYGEEFGVYLSLPTGSVLKKDYEEMFKSLYEHKRNLAVEIADRLTK